MNQAAIQSLARAVIETEASAIASLSDRVDEGFLTACGFMLGCRGRVVVIGMGKSGHIGSKIAATLASTGTAAFFVHPAEASHGDIGMIKSSDVVLAISNSGETEEVNLILPLLKRLGAKLIAMTGNSESTLARHADAHIDVSVEKEACPLGLAPTSSTTASLAMGDALAIALLDRRGFTEQDFARSHPGGRLCRRLLLHIGDIMHTGNDIPKVASCVSLSQALLEMTRAGIGMTAITSDDDEVLGIFTDGDLRRVFEDKVDPNTASIETVMTQNCTTVNADILAAEGLAIMQEKKINSLLVVDESNKLIGALNMHTFLRAGVA